MPERSTRQASDFLGSASFVWHQRFRLAGDVYTPGANDIEWLARTARLPEDLTGKSVLDVGTTNGGGAFEAERRGARAVLATDIVPASWFGFDQLRDFLRSHVEFRQVSVYELSSVLEEQFDVVISGGFSTTCATRCSRSTTSASSRASCCCWRRRWPMRSCPMIPAPCRSRASTGRTSSPRIRATGSHPRSPRFSTGALLQGSPPSWSRPGRPPHRNGAWCRPRP